ncbi:MAG TPA: hypothetical protein VFI73_11665 [Candidatus Nitrosopolaris sp.]|nr:hypothetical protein [Candidatus Nitrosopolaris sp.]
MTVALNYGIECANLILKNNASYETVTSMRWKNYQANTDTPRVTSRESTNDYTM